MIIIIGKETRAKLISCAYYVSQCGELYKKEHNSAGLAKYCEELSDWLFDVLRWPKKNKKTDDSAKTIR